MDLSIFQEKSGIFLHNYNMYNLLISDRFQSIYKIIIYYISLTYDNHNTSAV